MFIDHPRILRRWRTSRPRASTRSAGARPRTSAGFTLIETLITLGITGVLSSLAYPSFDGQLQRTRRNDALVSIMQAQLAEERWRANSSRYGTLAEIGVSAASPSGHYALAVTDTTADGYRIGVAAVGRQSRDAGCRFMRLSVAGGDLEYGSGPDATLGNASATNRMCWSQ